MERDPIRPGIAASTRSLALFAALGGGLGALTRHALGGLAPLLAGGGLPWPILFANAGGSILLGVLMGIFQRRPVAPEIQALLAAGFCGGLTTFSTFAYEVLALLAAGKVLIAIGYMTISVGVCVAGVGLGLRIGGSSAPVTGATH